MSDLMRKAGFLDTDDGPHATKLRALMDRQRSDGLVSRSPGTWADGPYWQIDAETRAKAFLAVEWSIERGHTYRVDCLDPPIDWQYNARTRKWRLIVKWSRMPAWLGDRRRELGMRFRVWRDRHLSNPYA